MIRQEIYKDYGTDFVFKEEKRMNSALGFYHGSAKNLESVI